MLEFDMEAIKAKGFELVTPVIVTNDKQFSEVELAKPESVHIKGNDSLFKIRFIKYIGGNKE